MRLPNVWKSFLARPGQFTEFVAVQKKSVNNLIRIPLCVGNPCHAKIGIAKIGISQMYDNRLSASKISEKKRNTSKIEWIIELCFSSPILHLVYYFYRSSISSVMLHLTSLSLISLRAVPGTLVRMATRHGYNTVV